LSTGASRWKNVLLRVYAGTSENRIFSLAAASTYFGLLAIFPALAALIGIYGLFSDPSTIDAQLVNLQGVLPEGRLTVIGDELKRISSQNGGTLGLAMVGGLLVSLWSANSAAKSLFDSLNQVYGEKEERGYLRLTLITLVFTLGGVAVAILAVGAVMVLPNVIGIPPEVLTAMRFAKWPLLFVLIAFALALVYRFGPNRQTVRWKWLTWGSAIAAALWIITSFLFSWYAGNFGSFNKTYGSLGAVVGFMMWIWISMIVVLLGAEIDAALEPETPRQRHLAVAGSEPVAFG
jgi:membrane protein